MYDKLFWAMATTKVPHEDIMKLIDIVKHNPSLFDPGHHDYKNSSHHERMWNLIAREMGREGMEGFDWRRKWINRRDTYVKKRRQIRASQSADLIKQVKSWRFFHAMTFLDRCYEGSNDSADDSGHALAANEEDSNADMPADGDSNESDTNSCHTGDGLKPTSLTESGKRRVQFPSSVMRLLRRKLEDRASGAFSYNLPSLHLPPSMSDSNSADDDITTHLITVNDIPITPEDQFDQPPSPTHHQSQSSPSSPLSSPGALPLTAVTEVSPLFQAYAMRLEKLPDRTQSFLQLQMAQIFFNAENPDLPPIPITPLPNQSSALSPLSSSRRRANRKQSQGQDNHQIE